jgi:hypothetical protein
MGTVLRTGRACLWAASFALASSAAQGAAAQSLIADKNGCQTANPHPAPNQSISWSGACKDGLLSGPGVLQRLQDGVVEASYQGSFWQGQLSGSGSATLRDGARYTGNFINNEFAGEGTMVWPSGDRYQGHWTAGKRTGHGELTRTSGEHYEGGFFNGLYEGQGVMHYPDHSSYEGNWAASKRAGQGTQIDSDGTRYIGEFRDDRPVGQVLVEKPDGTRQQILVGAGHQANAVQTGSQRCAEKSGHEMFYPPAAKDNHIFVGQARVHFEVDQDGQVTHIRSVESTNAIFDEAALFYVVELNCRSGLAGKSDWTFNWKTAGDEPNPVSEIAPPAEVTDGRRVLLLRVLDSDMPHDNGAYDHFARNVGEGFAMRVSAMLRSRKISVAHQLDLDPRRTVGEKIRDGARLAHARYVIVPRIEKPSGDQFASAVKVVVDYYQLRDNAQADDSPPIFSKSYTVTIPQRGERPAGIVEMARDVVDSLDKDGRLTALEANCNAKLCPEPLAAN